MSGPGARGRGGVARRGMPLRVVDVCVSKGIFRTLGACGDSVSSRTPHTLACNAPRPVPLFHSSTSLRPGPGHVVHSAADTSADGRMAEMFLARTSMKISPRVKVYGPRRCPWLGFTVARVSQLLARKRARPRRHGVGHAKHEAATTPGSRRASHPIFAAYALM